MRLGSAPGGLNPFPHRSRERGVGWATGGPPFSSQKRLQMIRFKELPAILSGPGRAQGSSRSLGSLGVPMPGWRWMAHPPARVSEWNGRNGFGFGSEDPFDLHARDPIGLAFLAGLASMAHICEGSVEKKKIARELCLKGPCNLVS